MTPELTPINHSERASFYAVDKLRHFVKFLTTSEDNIEESENLRSYTVPLEDGVYMQTMTIPVPRSYVEIAGPIFPDNLFTIGMYTEQHHDFIESISIGSGQDDTLLIRVGVQEQDSLGSENHCEIENYIHNFFARYHLDDIDVYPQSIKGS